MIAKSAADVAAPLLELITRLKTFRVDWHTGEGKALKDEPEYELGIDIEESDLDHANVVSSVRKPTPWEDPKEVRHALAIDLDVPAYFVPSSTEGHGHLYVDVPKGIPHHRYMALLSALADAGIIEPGYAAVSIKRGRSDLRLPWVAKGDALPEAPAKVATPTPVSGPNFPAPTIVEPF